MSCGPIVHYLCVAAGLRAVFNIAVDAAQHVMTEGPSPQQPQQPGAQGITDERQSTRALLGQGAGIIVLDGPELRNQYTSMGPASLCRPGVSLLKLLRIVSLLLLPQHMLLSRERERESVCCVCLSSCELFAAFLEFWSPYSNVVVQIHQLQCTLGMAAYATVLPWVARPMQQCSKQQQPVFSDHATRGPTCVQMQLEPCIAWSLLMQCCAGVMLALLAALPHICVSLPLSSPLVFHRVSLSFV